MGSFSVASHVSTLTICYYLSVLPDTSSIHIHVHVRIWFVNIRSLPSKTMTPRTWSQQQALYCCVFDDSYTLLKLVKYYSRHDCGD